MARYRAWQRGAADLVAVAVGLTILSIVAAGTAGSMIYGREALARQERYKSAAFILRGKMEEVQTALQLIEEARNPESSQSLIAAGTYPAVPIDRVYMNGEVHPVYVTISRERIQIVDLLETSYSPDYYLLTMKARWREPDYAENRNRNTAQDREIKFTTAIVVRATLG
ncbi:hypothetical protein EHM69_01550 [candidate division KSB1 bacterium]|nr:MAG: hypothetical protein EHM69_01550 [candidate division KSB1 bacterium]